MSTHWSDKYVGAAYIPEVADCAALAARIARELLGIECGLPTAHASTLRDQTRQILAHRDEFAERVDAPIDGQPALFKGRGHLCHIGTMCRIANEWWVLHADQSAGHVIRQRLRDMTLRGYQIEGYYKWK